MARKAPILPDYGTVKQSGVEYYRTRIKDADGKRVSLYALTKEDLYKKEMDARREVEEILFRRENPTVADYCQKWLMIKSASVTAGTLEGYERILRNYILPTIGKMYLADVTADDIRIAMISVTKRSSNTYAKANMLVKCIFGAAERNELIEYNPSTPIAAKGGTPTRHMDALTDEQVQTLLDAVKGLTVHTFIMIGLYAGLRREEILGLKWDCVFLDAATPYISVRRAWRSNNNKVEVSTTLKSKAAKRDIPIPQNLVECLRRHREQSHSEYVISNRRNGCMTENGFVGLWATVKTRSTQEHFYYVEVNGVIVKRSFTPIPGSSNPHNRKIRYTIDFHVTPHMLRHTYITNLIYNSVDPKTVQYLAGHENSKTTMDIYAKLKYNKPEELHGIVNQAFGY